MGAAFQAIVDLLAAVLVALRGLTGSYGIAVILLTVAIRLVLHPLTRKQLKSMKAMQALAPQITALREKYAHDQQTLNMEVMNLYRANNVNPFGGCLPVVVQLPLLYALFAVFRRQGLFNGATFLGLPLDLVISRSSFFSAQFWAELVQGIARYPLMLVIFVLVGVTTYLQQRMSITDPQQARAFVFMPVLFTLFSPSFPLALSLYWIVSTLASIAEYRIVVGAPGLTAVAVVGGSGKPVVLPQRPKRAKKR